jgi:hypothetical protein
MEERPCTVEKAKQQTDVDDTLCLRRSVAVTNCKDGENYLFSHVTYVLVSVSVVCGHRKALSTGNSSEPKKLVFWVMSL